jgi:hypothetical protein
MRRLLTVLLLLVLGPGASAQQTMHPGKERWPIKTSVVDDAKVSKGKLIPFSEFAALPDPAPPVKKNDKKYQSKLIPKASGAKLAEGDMLRLKGWLHLVAQEGDGDYHIQISDSPTDGGNCVVVEVPKDDAEYVADAELRPHFRTVREFISSKLLNGKTPSSSGNVMKHPPFVVVTGQLFYDDSHVGDKPRGKKGMKAATLWEIHPVTVMAFAPKPK